ncbi:hypothetical protein [Amycolatopsis sp. MtRt-6]|uniref:Rv1733c family protein n=1 Tax=Amycolatopsis sp. MtRt-6 TaxID=2792782 RepID=UPI001F5D5A78|nr:hypothetical protein [Amycolatopsis sp. MtRt-6]
MWRTILPGRGSVARASDRFQAGVGVFVVLLALAALPVAAGFGSETYVRQQVRSAQQLGERTRVTATLLADGPPMAANSRAGVVGSGRTTDATWVLADGTRRVGQVAAARGTLTGETSTIWVDRTGNPVDPPLSSAGVVIEAVGAEHCLREAGCPVVVIPARTVPEPDKETAPTPESGHQPNRTVVASTGCQSRS